jgi:hypothetical protein
MRVVGLGLVQNNRQFACRYIAVVEVEMAGSWARAGTE